MGPVVFRIFTYVDFRGIELRAVLHAAVDDPRPEGKTDIFLNRYQTSIFEVGSSRCFPMGHGGVDTQVARFGRIRNGIGRLVF